MGVEYSSTKVRISDRKTLAADSYYIVHYRFDLHYYMAIFDQSVPINFSTLVQASLNLDLLDQNQTNLSIALQKNGRADGLPVPPQFRRPVVRRKCDYGLFLTTSVKNIFPNQRRNRAIWKEFSGMSGQENPHVHLTVTTLQLQAVLPQKKLHNPTDSIGHACSHSCGGLAASRHLMQASQMGSWLATTPLIQTLNLT